VKRRFARSVGQLMILLSLAACTMINQSGTGNNACAERAVCAQGTVGGQHAIGTQPSVQSSEGNGADSPPPPPNSSPRPLSASILEPSNDSEVSLCTAASGHISNLPTGKSVWLFIQIPNQSDRPAGWYALDKLKPDPEGHWSVALLQIGNPGPGRPYWLELFLANSSQVAIGPQDVGNVEYSSTPPGFDPKPLATDPVHRRDTASGDSCG
jgi:hypothetical protein